MDICFIVHKIIQYYHLLVTQILPSLTIGDRLPFDRTTYFLNSFLLLTQENDPRSSCIFSLSSQPWNLPFLQVALVPFTEE